MHDEPASFQSQEVDNSTVQLEEVKKRSIVQRIKDYFTYERKRVLYTILYFIVLIGIVVFFIYNKTMMLINPPPEEPVDYSQYDWYIIPYIYIINYVKNAWYSLILAFLLAGIIYEFIPNTVIKKRFGGGKFYHYLLAAALAPVFITCSCSVIPIYIGILAAGASMGVAMTFFLMAPAANFITILLTGEYIGWDLGAWRLGFSFVAAVICGIVFDQFKFSKKIKEEFDAKLAVQEGNKPLKKLTIKKTIHDRVENAYTFSFKIVKTILPRLLIGLIVVSFLVAYIPDSLIENYFNGIRGIFLGALLGGPLYTPALVEIAVTQSFLEIGMDRSTALAFMMGQPYDFVSYPANAKYFKWRGIGIYTTIFFFFSVISAILFALAYRIPL